MAKRAKELSALISEGRARRGVPTSRSEVLAALLRKRAAAWQGGMEELEAKLRNQILWSLPVERPGDDAAAADQAGCNGHRLNGHHLNGHGESDAA